MRAKVSISAVVLASSPACHHALLPLKQRRKWFSAVEMGDHCGASILGSLAVGLPSPAPLVLAHLEAVVCTASKQHSPDVDVVRIVQGRPGSNRPCRPRTCCLNSLCAAATSACNLAFSGRNTATFSCC